MIVNDEHPDPLVGFFIGILMADLKDVVNLSTERIDQARFDHQPFNYNDYQAVPIWSPDQGGWGFWFFGLWIPL